MKWPWKAMPIRTGFAWDVIRSFPEEMRVPQELSLLFKWQEGLGLNQAQGEDQFAKLDPQQRDWSMFTAPVSVGHAKAFAGSNDPAIYRRVAPFCRTGGDGSYAALWLDEHDQTRFVHVGSGSGSTAIGILVESPIDFLRLISIGYCELCWPEQYDLTPDEVWDRYATGDEEFVRPMHPSALKNWVEKTFDVRVPSKASEIVPTIADMDAEMSDDPFWLWQRSLPIWQA